jgi:hypothetical protein
MKKKHKAPMLRTRAPGQLSHARKRFKQRYGRDISGDQLKALVTLAQADKVVSKITDRGNLRVKLRIGDELICFVYNSDTLQILTFLKAK